MDQLRQILNALHLKWECFRGRHAWVEVERYMGHDIGSNTDRCKHCPKTKKWLG